MCFFYAKNRINEIHQAYCLFLPAGVHSIL